MSNSDFIKGIGVGVVAGGTLGMAMASNKKKMKKSKGHAIKMIGEVMENVSDVFNL